MGTPPAAPSGTNRKQQGVSYYLSYLRSLLFTNLLIYSYTAVCGTLSLCSSLFDSQGRWQHAFARLWSWLILRTSGIRTRVEGLENLAGLKTAIYCANHQSAMDIPILFVNLPVQFRFVAKRSLFKLPFLGWHLTRSGHIPVDRGRPKGTRMSLDAAAERIRAGSSVVLFPEGHRSRDGKMLPFRSGSFYLAIQSGVPIVPITLNGTRAVLKPDTYHVRPGLTEMIVHPPVATSALRRDDVDTLAAKVQAQITSRFVPCDP
ncbi:MAG: lysophospholipid acyltransferase family protein [Terriglobia bacterium]|jgi:1-acyl-sn-glycerol-3-phosphate acyltransferase